LGTTWEEKDATDWCTKTLERCLLDAPASPYFSELSSTACVASVKGVLDVKSDASVAIVGGTKRYIFDYHATVGQDIRRGGEVVVSGSLRLPEVHSANMSSGKRRRSWRWRYWLGSARSPPPPGMTISEQASRRKKRRLSKGTRHGRQEERFGICGES
jgi:hypothetical protein